MRAVAWALAVLVAVPVAAVAILNLQRFPRETRTAAELAPPDGDYVEAGDANVFVQQWGPPDGPVLLLVHGTGAWSGTWFGLPRSLAAQGWRVVAVDLPPFGMSTPASAATAPAYTRAAQAARLHRVLAWLGTGKAVVVGHSFGAGPALEAAMSTPSAVARLVLVAPALGLGSQGEPPGCGDPGPLAPLMAWRGLRTALVGATATVPAFSATLLGRFVHRKDAVTDASVAPYQVPFARRGVTAALGDWAVAFGAAACEPARSLVPAELTAWAANGPPVSLLWGDQDRITPIAQAASLRRWMPATTLTVLPGVGHIPHLEAPDDFERALLAAIGPAQRAR